MREGPNREKMHGPRPTTGSYSAQDRTAATNETGEKEITGELHKGREGEGQGNRIRKGQAKGNYTVNDKENMVGENRPRPAVGKSKQTNEIQKEKVPRYVHGSSPGRAATHPLEAENNS